VDELIGAITDVIKWRDLPSLGVSMLCLKSIAKRSPHYSNAVRSHVFYSILLEAIDNPSVSMDDRHLIIDLFVIFPAWDFAEPHLRHSIALVQEYPDFHILDRIRFLWWLLKCDRRAIKFLSSDFIVPFLASSLDSAAPWGIRRFALLTSALLFHLDTALVPAPYDLIFHALDPANPKLCTAAIACLQAMVDIDWVHVLMAHDFFGIARVLLADDAPFLARAAMLRCLAAFLPKCPREALPGLLDPDLLSTLIRALEHRDLALLRSLFALFEHVIGADDDELAAAFWAVFEAHDGWALVAEIEACESAAIHNIGVMFFYNHHAIEPPDDF
jgi:hypothetical protein